MALVSADHAHDTFAADDLAVAADFLDRSRNSHFILLKRSIHYRSVDRETMPATERWASTNFWQATHLGGLVIKYQL